MKQNTRILTSALALLVAAAACDKKSPTTPSPSPSAPAAQSSSSADVSAEARGSVSLTVPTPTAPNENAQIRYVDQPVTLVVKNAVTTGSGSTYTFEVATDAGFTNKVYSKEGVAEGNAQTSQTLDRLTGAKTYYWRARATSNGVAGPFAKVRAFAVGPEVTLGTPTLASPGSNTTVGGQPTLTVTNVTKTGPAGQVIYQFEVSDSSAFANILFATSVAEAEGAATSVTVAPGLDNGTYWWRVKASDPSNAVTTDYSVSNPFQVQLFDMRQATIWDNPSDLGYWAETATITSIEFTNDAFLVDFDKRTGPGRWPDVGFGAGSLEYTLGMCLNIDSHWHCSAVVQFWYGRELTASGRPSEIARNWFYDSRWGRMMGYQPAYGETVGIFVAAGNLRDSGNVIVKERSKVVLMPFGGSYRPSSAAAPIRLMPKAKR